MALRHASVVRVQHLALNTFTMQMIVEEAAGERSLCKS